MNADIPLSYHDDLFFLDRAAASGRTVPQEVASAIEKGEMPERYRRNASTIPPADQARLARSRVLLVGCGGLGGHVLEYLVRAGVGTILACDPDRIEMHNANRQLLAATGTMGRPKVEAAKDRAAEINSLIRVVPMEARFQDEPLPAVNAVIDCLGGAAHRRELQATASAAKVPVISAGIAGWTALISTTWPGETGLAEFMNDKNGCELTQGIPSPAVGFAAALQATEAIRILIGRIPALRGSLLIADLAEMRFSTVSLQTGLDFTI